MLLGESFLHALISGACFFCRIRSQVHLFRFKLEIIDFSNLRNRFWRRQVALVEWTAQLFLDSVVFFFKLSLYLFDQVSILKETHALCWLAIIFGMVGVEVRRRLHLIFVII